MKIETFWTSEVHTKAYTFEKISMSSLSKRVDFRNPDGRITIALWGDSYTYSFTEFDIHSAPRGVYDVVVVETFNCFTLPQVDVTAKIVWEETDTLDKAWRAAHSALFPDD